jgi:hypothetical protein
MPPYFPVPVRSNPRPGRKITGAMWVHSRQKPYSCYLSHRFISPRLITWVCSDLEDMLREHELRSSKPLGFDVRNCSWEDVLRGLRRAKYNIEDSGPGEEQLQRSAHEAGGESSYSTSGLKDSPDELAPLRGGLAAVFCVGNLSCSETILY